MIKTEDVYDIEINKGEEKRNYKSLKRNKDYDKTEG